MHCRRLGYVRCSHGNKSRIPENRFGGGHWPSGFHGIGQKRGTLPEKDYGQSLCQKPCKRRTVKATQGNGRKNVACSGFTARAHTNRNDKDLMAAVGRSP